MKKKNKTTIYKVVHKLTGVVVYQSRNLAACQAMHRAMRPTFNYEVREETR